jgi:hypothetical protein
LFFCFAVQFMWGFSCVVLYTTPVCVHACVRACLPVPIEKVLSFCFLVVSGCVGFHNAQKRCEGRSYQVRQARVVPILGVKTLIFCALSEGATSSKYVAWAQGYLPCLPYFNYQTACLALTWMSKSVSRNRPGLLHLFYSY